jgi:uncharacterized protein involved in exopolysaccharide biosynthesis
LDQSYVESQNLEQEEKEAQDNYLLYTHYLDEIRLNEALDRDKFSNVVMIEKPVVSTIPVFPRLGLNLAAGFLVGLLLSFGLAFLRELREIPPTSASDSAETWAQPPQDRSFKVASSS